VQSIAELLIDARRPMSAPPKLSLVAAIIDSVAD
jgi:hypothetical protein